MELENIYIKNNKGNTEKPKIIVKGERGPNAHFSQGRQEMSEFF